MREGETQTEIELERPETELDWERYVKAFVQITAAYDEESRFLKTEADIKFKCHHASR